MARLRSLAWLSAFIIATPAAASAQTRWGGPWQAPQSQQGYREGFIRGERAGLEDSRRGDAFRFADENDYQRGDVGYRPAYGNREWYRSDFRYGFEVGYRQGYVQGDRGRTGGFPNGRQGLPPWSNGRGVARFDLAYDNGYKDGYDAGLADARANRRPEPLTERRYRNGDNGYERWYGTEDAYRINYREAFKTGYGRGYQDEVRYR